MHHPRTRPTLLAVALLALGATGIALAVSRGDSGGDHRQMAYGYRMHGPAPLIEEADSNRDGSVDAAEWSALFTKLDADKNGKIEASEFPGFHAPPPEMLAFVIAHDADSDGDGKITEAEWQSRVTALDKDKDGALSVDELSFRHPMHDWSKERAGGLPPFVATWDTNGDGKLEASELDALFAAADQDGDGVLTRPMERHQSF